VSDSQVFKNLPTNTASNRVVLDLPITMEVVFSTKADGSEVPQRLAYEIKPDSMPVRYQHAMGELHLVAKFSKQGGNFDAYLKQHHRVEVEFELEEIDDDWYEVSEWASESTSWKGEFAQSADTPQERQGRYISVPLDPEHFNRLIPDTMLNGLAEASREAEKTLDLKLTATCRIYSPGGEVLRKLEATTTAQMDLQATQLPHDPSNSPWTDPVALGTAIALGKTWDWVTEGVQYLEAHRANPETIRLSNCAWFVKLMLEFTNVPRAELPKRECPRTGSLVDVHEWRAQSGNPPGTDDGDYLAVVAALHTHLGEWAGSYAVVRHEYGRMTAPNNFRRCDLFLVFTRNDEKELEFAHVGFFNGKRAQSGKPHVVHSRDEGVGPTIQDYSNTYRGFDAIYPVLFHARYIGDETLTNQSSLIYRFKKDPWPKGPEPHVTWEVLPGQVVSVSGKFCLVASAAELVDDSGSTRRVLRVQRFPCQLVSFEDPAQVGTRVPMDWARPKTPIEGDSQFMPKPASSAGPGLDPLSEAERSLKEQERAAVVAGLPEEAWKRLEQEATSLGQSPQEGVSNLP
jgi:hypothetical protein